MRTLTLTRTENLIEFLMSEVKVFEVREGGCVNDFLAQRGTLITRSSQDSADNSRRRISVWKGTSEQWVKSSEQ